MKKKLSAFVTSIRGVLNGWREYICFFAALIIIQSMFFICAMSFASSDAYTRKLISDNFDYHVSVTGMTQTQKIAFENAANQQRDNVKYYLESVRYTEEDGMYGAYVMLDSDSVYAGSGFRVFVKDYVPGSGYITVFSPLYDYNREYLLPSILVYSLICLLLVALSVLILNVLYRIRLNHFSFMYGIYMTYGADSRRLRKIAVNEMFSVSVLTFVPSMLISLAAVGILSGSNGIRISFPVFVPFAVILLNVISVLISVSAPMKSLSKKPPVRLIIAGDNSNLVTSPKRSFRIFGKSFPLHYELYSVIRFRKYYLRLLISAVAFSTLFMSGLYIAEMASTHDNRDSAEYVISCYNTAPDSYTAEDINNDALMFIDGIESVSGVAYCSWDVSTTGSEVLAHMLVKRDNIASTENIVVSQSERSGYYGATDTFAYTAVDRAYIDSLYKRGCTFDGNPYSLLETEKGIIVSEDIYNKRNFYFSPGDSVYLCTYEGGPDIDYSLLDKKQLLRDIIKKGIFTYEEYKICAVIKDIPDEGYFIAGVTNENYENLSGYKALRNKINIYIENGTEPQDCEAAQSRITRVLKQSLCEYWQIKSNNTFFRDTVQRGRNMQGFIAVISILLLCVTPLVWFLSQLTFYGKQQGEFFVLEALGANRNKIRGICLIAGCVLSVLAFVLTLILSVIADNLIYFTVNSLLPALGIIKAVRYELYMPWQALIICASASLICGFLSSYVPYIIYTIKRTKNYTAVKPDGET